MQGSRSAYLRIGTTSDTMGPPASTPFSMIRRHVMCPSLIAVLVPDERSHRGNIRLSEELGVSGAPFK